MTQQKENTKKTIGYLFGELDSTERDALEDRIFSDEDLALFLRSVEKDLIDDYVRGEMGADLRQRFEQNYLISENRREKVRLAGVLQKKVLSEKEIPAPLAVDSKPSFWQTLADFIRFPSLAWAGGLAAILLLILFGGLLMWRQSPTAPEIVRDDNANRPAEISPPPVLPENSPVNNNVADKPPKLESKTPEKNPLPTAAPTKNRETVPPPRIFIATLLPPLRSGETPVLSIPKNAESVQLRIVHDNLQSFAAYRAEIRNRTGATVAVRQIPFNVRNPARPIILNIKTSALAPGTYELILSGITGAGQAEEIKFYNFGVTKK